MFTFLKYLIRNAQPSQFTGALPDDRKVEQKKDDVHFSEIVATASPVLWREKTKDTWRKFPELNQFQSLTCGANALQKALGVMFNEAYGTYLALSRAHIYQRRLNRPNGGMAMYDMFRIASEGVTLEMVVKDKLVVDADYDNAVIEPWMKKEAETWKVGTPVYLQNDIETIASVIQTTGKGVILLTYFLSGEWSKEVPYIVNSALGQYDPSSLRHFVVAVDYTLYNGKKSLIIEDSAHFGGISRRVVTEDWVKKRVIGAGYLMSFKFQEKQGQRPTYDGISIISAQRCLQYEGLFPNNISFIENVGPTTKKALSDFQKKYDIYITQTLDQQTKNKLHALYP